MTKRKRNNMKARKYFGIDGNNNLVLHHKDPSLIEKDIDRYNEWNPEDLVVMTRSEHKQLHSALNNPLRGKPAWNKGLTKDTDDRVKKYCHKPKGFNSGLKHTGGNPKKSVICVELNKVFESTHEARRWLVEKTGKSGFINGACNKETATAGGYH